MTPIALSILILCFPRDLVPISRFLYSMVVEVLGNLDAGDKLAVLGNHDQGDGKKTELRLVRELERVGIRVLRNSSQKFVRGRSSLYAAGTDDYWISCDLKQALREVSPNEFKILLCHSPDVRQDIKSGTKIDLTLCGHTHGGQIAIPFNFLDLSKAAMAILA